MIATAWVADLLEAGACLILFGPLLAIVIAWLLED